MCITRDRWRSLKSWNWDGDYVIHECVVPSNRRAVGSRRTYDIDVREFLLTEHNEVMRRTIREDLRRHVCLMPDGDWNRFEARLPGSFDYRVRVIADFVAERIAYPSDTTRAPANDPWQFPDETLVLGFGDCEDRALLIASLLRAAGVSSFHFRVALGQMIVGGERKDHVWVMYKNEAGQWTVVDPAPSQDRIAAALTRNAAPAEPPSYEPFFLFNDVHLWSVRRPEQSDDLRAWLTREWDRVKPKFHGAVHLTIIERALRGVAPQLSQEIEKMFRRPILGLIGPLVDDIDRMDYDPAWHFDNGYIQEGWSHVEQRLASFRDDRSNVKDFAIAAHAIADFYAHTNYAHIAKPVGAGRLPPIYDTKLPPLGGAPRPDYTSGRLSLVGNHFTRNATVLGKHTPRQAAELWAGQIISGRYAQEDDTQPGLLNHLFMEGVIWIPKHYRNQWDFWKRGVLPHHNEIAVDEAHHDGHRLYPKAAEYARQFQIRRDLAIQHIRTAFREAVSGVPT